MEAADGDRSGGLALVATVALVAVAFLIAVAPWATDDFGYSLDGFNGSVWGLGARAAADDPVGSRLGGIQPDGDRYANHPPLTVWSAAVGSAVSGDRPGGVRAPAIAASVLALVALAVLLRDAGLRPEAVGAGVAMAGTSGMFLTYGAMLDTPVVSLAFGLGAVAGAQRVWQGRPPATPVLGALGVLAVLSGWQAALAATLAAAVCLLAPSTGGGSNESSGGRASPRRGAGVLFGGVAVGVLLTAGWIGWVHGSLRPLLDQAGVRTGERGNGTDAGWFTAMRAHLTDLYGPGSVLILLTAAVLVALIARPDRDGTSWWRPHGLRPVAAVLVTTVVGYTLLFRNGAAVHDYWTYWGVALVGVGTAAVVQLALTRTPLAGVTRPASALVVTVVVLPLAIVGLARQTTAEIRIREGLDLLPVLGQVPEPADPHVVPVAVYNAPGELPWADHLVHGRAIGVEDVDGLRDLPPDLPVLLVLRGPPSPALRSIAIASNDRFALVPAADLAVHLEP